MEGVCAEDIVFGRSIRCNISSVTLYCTCFSAVGVIGEGGNRPVCGVLSAVIFNRKFNWFTLNIFNIILTLIFLT